MLALSQVFAAIFELLPEPPGWHPRGPVDPRIDPEALAAFGLAELAHAELPLRYAFERAQDARDVWRWGVPDAPTASRPETPPGDPTLAAPVADLPAVADLPGLRTAGDDAGVEWPSAPLRGHVIRPGSAFGPDASPD